MIDKKKIQVQLKFYLHKADPYRFNSFIFYRGIEVGSCSGYLFKRKANETLKDFEEQVNNTNNNDIFLLMRDAWASNPMCSSDKFPYNMPFRNIVCLHIMKLDDEYRGMGLGLVFMNHLLQYFSGDLILIHPCPCPNTGTILKKVEKLQKHWQKCGFKLIEHQKEDIRDIEGFYCFGDISTEGNKNKE